MRILICGGRDFTDYDLFLDKMAKFKEILYFPTIIHGGCKGADMLADRYAKYNGWELEIYEADWDKHGKAAGPIRNKLMLEEGKPDLVIAFPGGRGTENMINLTKEAGVDLFIVGGKNGK